MSNKQSASSMPGVLGSTRLPGPTARETEEQAAAYVEESLAFYDRHDLGPRTRRDGGDGLRVDFTYDSAMRPAALEVTALVVPDVRALGAELIKLQGELQHLVRSEHLGAWLVGVRVGARVRDLKPSLIEFLRSQGGRAGVALFSQAAAPEGLTPAALRLLAKLFDAGLVTAMRSNEGDALSVFPPVSGTASAEGERGFGTLLQRAIAANVDKLQEARPRETHLVVTADDPDLSADPARTPAARLPEGIDVLWVLLGYFNAKWTYRLWRTTASDPRWHLLRHPLGHPPGPPSSARGNRGRTNLSHE